MTLDSIESLKSEINQHYFNELEKQSRIGVENLSSVRIEKRLTLGHQLLENGEYILNIRVQRTDSYAYRLALEYLRMAKGEGNIGVIPKIAIPPVNFFKTRKKKTRGANRRFNSPLHIGASIGHLDGGTGTLGLFVEHKGDPSFISCNHVMALLGKAENYDYIYHPGRSDKRNLSSDDRVAQLTRNVEISKNNENALDFAVAQLMDENNHTGNKIIDKFNSPFTGKEISSVDDYDLLSPNIDLHKVGRTTGYTSGTLSSFMDEITVNIPLIGNVVFENLIEIISPTKTPFTKPGDSGSVVFTEEMQAVGMHFAGGLMTLENKDYNVSYAFNLSEAFEAFELDLLK